MAISSRVRPACIWYDGYELGMYCVEQGSTNPMMKKTRNIAERQLMYIALLGPPG